MQKGKNTRPEGNTSIKLMKPIDFRRFAKGVGHNIRNHMITNGFGDLVCMLEHNLGFGLGNMLGVIEGNHLIQIRMASGQFLALLLITTFRTRLLSIIFLSAFVLELDSLK